MNIGHRIVLAREHAGLNQRQLAEMIGMKQPSLSKLESGGSNSTSFVAQIAAATGVRAIWLAEEKGAMLDADTSKPTKEYDYINRVKGPHLSAGNGELLWDYEELERSHAFRKDWLRNRRLDPRRCKLWDVRGESMSPTLSDGDTVMINLAERDVISGEVYALIAEDGLRVKRLQRRADGLIWMLSDNPMQHKYPPEPITSTHAAVIGRVVWRSGGV